MATLAARHKLSRHYLSTPVISQVQVHVTPSSSSGASYCSQSDLSSSSSASTAASSGYTEPRPQHSPRPRWSPPVSQSLSPREVATIQASFSSLRAVCWVCPGLVSLVTADLVSRAPLVPVLVLNLGGSRARQQRGVELVLADRRTGLAILRDTLDTNSDYRETSRLECAPGLGGEIIHKWHYSRDHRLVLGLAWLPPTAHTANQFLHRVHQLMDCPENVGLSGPRQPSAKTPRRRPQQQRPRKAEISSPCGFRHHASLSLEQWGEMTASSDL